MVNSMPMQSAAWLCLLSKHTTSSLQTVVAERDNSHRNHCRILRAGTIYVWLHIIYSRLGVPGNSRREWTDEVQLRAASSLVHVDLRAGYRHGSSLQETFLSARADSFSLCNCYWHTDWHFVWERRNYYQRKSIKGCCFTIRAIGAQPRL
jgi:hypothetical protein